MTQVLRTPPMQRAYLSLGGGQIHYRSTGAADGTPVALLHQSPGSSIMYERLASQLPHGLRIIAPDSPGFGQSSELAGEISIEALADAVQQALGGLDERPWHLFGHHTGSMLAMAIAHAGQLPLASLTLSGPPYLDEQLRALLTTLYQAPTTDMDAHVQGSWERIRSAASDVAPQLLMRDFAQGLLVRDLPAVYAAGMRFDPLTAIRGLTLPTMILAGETDPIRTGFPTIREALPHARYISIADGGIQMCESQAAQIAAELAAFVAEVSG
jgi:pimeloyl-ACP methyl ester carboxylesterase